MKEEEEKEDDEANALWDCGSPLYDSFELTSLYNLLDRKLMALPFPGGTSSSRSGEVGVSGDSRGQSKVVVLDGFNVIGRRCPPSDQIICVAYQRQHAVADLYQRPHTVADMRRILSGRWVDIGDR
ncbi:hypothetical protein MRB53_002458 [Persea americana]|uniref:Uncharacterized protein n=1 Tax=Persea americana TaxID=3435 RepID=A0ACC2MUL1_PERAE|nr:hypothetical protein MRB53_002458 [Persea americana]